MGIDLQSGGRYVGHKQRDAPKSKNVYLNLLVQVSLWWRVWRRTCVLLYDANAQRCLAHGFQALVAMHVSL